ncbi:YheC/YheD family protein [Effusibacillus consociatus]|uniref:YheC/YheD family protein n=1 Tax=Effusibacillus consociatus TaxID=1117041 RepID=A0ABV9PX63_9BACL
MLGSGMIEALKCSSRTVRVPESWADRFGWSSGDPIQIAAGKKTVSASIDVDDKEQIAFSCDILWELKLPRIPVTWKVKKKSIRLGPFVAVYCQHTGSSEKPFSSITALLEDMTKLSRGLCIPFYVISIGGFHQDTKTVTCWNYEEKFNRWREAEFPWPDFCIKKIMTVPRMLRLIARRDIQLMRMSKCRMLYRPLGSKLKVYHILSQHASIVPHLPETSKISSLDDVLMFLKTYPLLYIKPSRGTQGRSVYRVSRLPEPGMVQIQFRRGDQKRKATIQLTENRTWFSKKFLSDREFLVQQGIHLTKDRQGRSADFRWLMQKDGLGQWNITARVARLGQKGSITTNVSTGADVLAVDEFLERAGFSPKQIPSVIDQMDALAVQIVRILEDHVGPLGELGIDFGLDRTGHPWLIEVNPNPGRKMLKILDPEVRALSLRRPLEYARYTAGFSDISPG